MPLSPVFRFHAYIAYAPEDNRPPGRPWADWLEEALETFEVPRNLAGKPTPFGPVAPRLTPVCKAEADRPTPLSPEIRLALEHSRTLVVICSPSAARSAVVAEEVRHFKEMGRDRVIALIVDGEPHAQNAAEECYPETLRYEVKRDGTLDREWIMHPVAVADVRRERQGVGAAERLAEARRILAAAVLGLPPEALPIHRPQGKARAATVEAEPKKGSAAVWIAILGFVLAGGAGWYAYQMQQQKLAAEDARRQSDQLVAFLQKNMREKLSSIGQLPLLAEANERVIEHFASATGEKRDSSSIAVLADALGDSAEILKSRGNLAAALETALQAVQMRQDLVAAPDAPTNAAFQLIGDQRMVAQILLQMKRTSEALVVAEQSRVIATALSKKRLGDAEVEEELARAHGEAGDILIELGRLEEAGRAYVAERELAAHLASAAPNDVRRQSELARSMERMSNLKQRQGDIPGALTELIEWQRRLQAQAKATPEDRTLQRQLTAAHLRLGGLHVFQRRFKEAVAEFRHAVEGAERTAGQDPANREAQKEYVTACRSLAESLVQADPAARTEALSWFQKALAHLDDKYPGNKDEEVSAMRADIERSREVVMRLK
jgi:eukaryotic-like serine/threonine-protein kinase